MYAKKLESLKSEPFRVISPEERKRLVGGVIQESPEERSGWTGCINPDRMRPFLNSY